MPSLGSETLDEEENELSASLDAGLEEAWKLCCIWLLNESTTEENRENIPLKHEEEREEFLNETSSAVPLPLEDKNENVGPSARDPGKGFRKRLHNVLNVLTDKVPKEATLSFTNTVLRDLKRRMSENDDESDSCAPQRPLSRDLSRRTVKLKKYLRFDFK
jgi:hypothetical protein